MNLHIMTDEKVVTRAIENFDCALPSSNRYIIMIPKVGYLCHHVKIESERIHRLVYNTSEFWGVVGDIKQYQYIIIHFLSKEAISFVRKINHPRIIWFIWGADLYNDILSYRGYPLFEEEEKRTDTNFLSFAKKIWNERIRLKIESKRHVYGAIKAIKKISYYSGCPGDYELLQSYFPMIGEKERKLFFYYALEDIIGQNFEDIRSVGNDIILGNSASRSNNHMSILRRLSELPLANRKVIVPLSYGGKNGNYIMEKGKALLGEVFLPITDFLPLDQYNKLLYRANVFIYNNYRQEAAGNIITALYIGGTVFLNTRNTLYSYFKDFGCILFTMDELEEKINYRLSENEVQNNRAVLQSYFNKNTLINIIKNNFS